MFSTIPGLIEISIEMVSSIFDKFRSESTVSKIQNLKGKEQLKGNLVILEYLLWDLEDGIDDDNLPMFPLLSSLIG